MLAADSDAASNTTMTDSKGRFSMLLPPGKYELVVETDQGTQARKTVKVGKTAMTGVTVGS
jgi:hypothetical protein